MTKIRRHSGTKKGIARLLDTLGFESIITPWHKEQPYSFSVHFWQKKQDLIEINIVDKIDAYITNIKSERDKCILFLTERYTTSLIHHLYIFPSLTITPVIELTYKEL